jgi:hypothetical protein
VVSREDWVASGDAADSVRALNGTSEMMLRQARLTRRSSMLSLTLTTINIALIAAFVPFYARYITSVFLFIFYGALALIAGALITLGLYESHRRRGDGYFQELSDLLQLLFGGDGENVDRVVVQRARLAVRSFSSAADLPFVSGKRGSAVYATVNLAILLGWVILAIVRTAR